MHFPCPLPYIYVSGNVATILMVLCVCPSILVKLPCCHKSLVTLVPSSMKLFTPRSFKTSSQRIAMDFTWATSFWTFNSCSSPAKVHWTVFGNRLHSRSCGREAAKYLVNNNPLLKPLLKCIYMKSNDKWTQCALWSVDHVYVVYTVHS